LQRRLPLLTSIVGNGQVRGRPEFSNLWRWEVEDEDEEQEEEEQGEKEDQKEEHEEEQEEEQDEEQEAEQDSEEQEKEKEQQQQEPHEKRTTRAKEPMRNLCYMLHLFTGFTCFILSGPE